MRTRVVVIVVMLCVGGLLATPAVPPLRASSADGFNLISVADEIQLGRQTQAEVREQTPRIDDGAVNNYLNGVFSQLVRRAGGPPYPYSITVANYAEVNAFSLPGGPVWVHRGAIEAADHESELAGVLAHEIGHIERRHVARLVSRQLVAGGLLTLLDRILPNDRSGKIGEIAVGLAAQSVMLKFSRDDEREADREGTRILRQAGWDARGLVEFLEQLRDRQGRDPSSVEIFLSNHPAPGERAAALRASRLSTDGRRDGADFQRIRARLKQMPQAPRMKRG